MAYLWMDRLYNREATTHIFNSYLPSQVILTYSVFFKGLKIQVGK